MLSRVADSLFWMSRYLERAEHTGRVLNVQLNLMLERGSGSDDPHWSRVLRSLGVDVDPDQEARPQALNLIGSAASPSSICRCIAVARENARQVREQTSTEMWEQLNRLYHDTRPPGDENPRDFLDAVRDGCHLFQGITDATMTHGEGWQFIQCGRFLERAQLLAILISVHYREFFTPGMTDAEPLEWAGLLQSCTAFEAYCKVYTADLRADRIAEFLVLNPLFPHSIRFSADALRQSLATIGAEVPSRRSERVDRLTGRMESTLAFGQIDEIMSGGLHSYLDTVRRQANQVSLALYQTFISYPVEAALSA